MTTTTKAATPSVAITLVNPLLARKMRRFDYWKEWMECWEKSKTVEEMMGLLHCGFDVPNTLDFDNRIEFYFSVADGWASPFFLLQPVQNEGPHDYEMRGALASKAFNMICQHFFKPEKWSYLHSNERRFTDNCEALFERGLFSVLMQFFRPENKEIRNIGRSREHPVQKNAHLFLIALPVFLWKWRERTIPVWVIDASEIAQRKEEDVKMRAQIEEGKLWMIEVLARLGGLSILNPWILEISKPCIVKLKEIALESELNRHAHHVEQKRKVRTIDEACYAGSSTAWFLKRRQLMLEQRKKLGIRKK